MHLPHDLFFEGGRDIHRQAFYIVDMHQHPLLERAGTFPDDRAVFDDPVSRHSARKRDLVAEGDILQRGDAAKEIVVRVVDAGFSPLWVASSPGLKNSEDPNPFLRLFWCIMLSLVPLTMILINANLNTIKTCAIITATPIIFVMLLLLYGWMRWMKKDYGRIPAYKMEQMFLDEEAAEEAVKEG